MDSLTIFSPSVKTGQGIFPAASVAKKKFKMSNSVQAYQNEKMRPVSEGNKMQSETLEAISKWLTTGDFRLEFYTSEDDGGVRVKIVPGDLSQGVMDMSLQAFVSYSLITI